MDATINGARIHYERSGAGFPVLFVHAGIAGSRVWEPQAKAFANHLRVRDSAIGAQMVVTRPRDSAIRAPLVGLGPP